MGQRGAHGHRIRIFGKDLCDQMSFGAMFQGQLHIKLSGNTHCGQNIIGLMGMGLEGDLTAHHRQHGVKFEVEIRLFAGAVLFGGIQFNTAHLLNLPETTIIALQNVGGGLGSMIRISGVIAACATVNASGKEGKLILLNCIPLVILTLIALAFTLIL